MEELQEKKEKILEYKKVFALSENEIEQIIGLWDEDAFVLETDVALAPRAAAVRGSIDTGGEGAGIKSVRVVGVHQQ